MFNARANKTDFSLLFHNCADFAREAINFYYPNAVHRSLIADAGIMTPKQAAKSLVRYAKRHPGLQLSGFVIPQVPGTVERSRPVRGVLEALVKTKKYILPLALLALMHPYFGGSPVVARIEGGHFNPRSTVGNEGSETEPGIIARLLQSQKKTGRWASLRPIDLIAATTNSAPVKLIGTTAKLLRVAHKCLAISYRAETHLRLR